MDLLKDPVFKTRYLKNKLRVKRWESDFMEKYGRKPNKHDIKEADASIKEAYKMYWKLKTRALEESLMDITFCDDVQSNVTNESPLKSSTTDQRQDKGSAASPEKLARDMENIDPHDGKHEVEGAIQTDMGNIEGVWGDHLHKSKQQSPKKKQALLIGRSSSFQLSRNKFENSSFAKRNPRKSLSSTRLRKSDKSIPRNSSIDRADAADSTDGFDVTAEETKSMFGETMKVTFEGDRPVLHCVNAVQQLVDGHVTCVNRKLDPGWLDRCARYGNLEAASLINPQRLSGTSDSGVESMESSIYSPKDVAPAVVRSSTASHGVSDEDEDFVCNSDSEEERRNKRIRNFKKQWSDQDSQLAKRRCVNTESNATARTAGTADDSASKQISNVNAINSNATHDNGCSKSETDDVNALRSIIDNDDANSSLANESVKVQCDKVDLGSSQVDPGVTTDDGTTCKNVQTASDQTRNEFKTTDTISKVSDRPHRESAASLNERSVKQHVLRRRARQIPSDDSDPDYTKGKKRQTKTRAKKATGKPTKQTAKKSTKQKTTSNERKASLRRSSRRELTPDRNDEEERGPGETQAGKFPIYGVETALETVPRFAMKPIESGDLVAEFSKSVCTGTIRDATTSAKTSARSADRAKLEKKIAAGTMNDNFVRINLKKKVFVRGKKHFNLSKYKKTQWKQRKKDLACSESNLDAADLIDRNGTACFKCGESGHFARNCPAAKSDALLPPQEADEGSSSDFPTLQEAEKMAKENAVVAHSHGIHRLPEKPASCSVADQVEDDMARLFASDDEDFPADTGERKLDTSSLGHKIPPELLSRLLPPQMDVVEPLYPVNEDGSLLTETPTKVLEALRMFGHENFRPGQEKAVMRILSGRSTLVTLSTGSGKSLCYQLPAYLYSQRSRCITLVISPLVSLMDDQVTGVPSFLQAACLHTGQTPTVREQVMRSVRDGTVNILLVSPEAVVAGEKSTGFGALLRQLPPIAFACIDETHCISQWSHNFRPSYLMVCRVLQEKLRVKTVLGLTATATRMTADSIVRHLCLQDGMAGVISDVPLPGNLILTVSKDENKDQALVALLRSERFQECDSVIVYCTRREECARIAGLLRTSLQDPKNPDKPNAKVSTTAEAYHAGMTSHRRKVVQREFMNGRIKIVVATVAFGMGINKSDIRAVIHYNMPGTFEGYVQEVGRCGRDGLAGHCHLFLNPSQDSDKWELRRHIHANGVDRHTIRHLLQRIFVPCSCARINEGAPGQRCPGHEVALSIDETVQALDITEETISTLLCYLELHPRRFITVLSSVYIRARVSSYNGPQGLKRAAQSSPPLAMAIALDMRKGISHETSNIIEFPIIDVASAIGWDSGVVKSHLKNLEWTTAGDGSVKRSGISVHYDKLGLRVKAPGDLTDVELDEALDALIARSRSQESSCLQQLEIISSALNRVSVPSIRHCCSVLDNNVTQRSEELKGVIRDYFQSDSPLTGVVSAQDEIANEQQIAADVRSLIMCYRDTRFTGRAVARIFHGIQSPNYSAVIWSKCRFWRAYLAADFNAIYKIATREILALR